MVFIDGVKYACDRCIRGHRVTTCTHTDQPLTMIKPKGRPSTQCAYCRETRRSKSINPKCKCDSPPEIDSLGQPIHSTTCPVRIVKEGCKCQLKNKAHHSLSQQIHHVGDDGRSNRHESQNIHSPYPASLGSNTPTSITSHSTLLTTTPRGIDTRRTASNPPPNKRNHLH
ncbi:copper-fist-domain-containing protein, partial [Nadsonia fulvescens var. elongata DSM 6958]